MNANYASAAALALQEGNVPIPIKPILKRSEYTTTTLRNTVNGETRRAEVYVIDQRDIELICRAVIEFEEVQQNSKLHLNTYGLRTSRFTDILDNNFRAKFIRLNENTPPTLAGFEEAKSQFIELYIENTALNNEKAYLSKYKKEREDDCLKLGDRLEEINNLMAKFPGAPGGQPPLEVQLLKQNYFNMMLDDWQINYVSSIDRLNDDEYTYNQLVKYMKSQQVTHNARQNLLKRKRGRSGFGYGHGYGRGYGGNWRNRENSENRPRNYPRYNSNYSNNNQGRGNYGGRSQGGRFNNYSSGRGGRNGGGRNNGNNGNGNRNGGRGNYGGNFRNNGGGYNYQENNQGRGYNQGYHSNYNNGPTYGYNNNNSNRFQQDGHQYDNGPPSVQPSDNFFQGGSHQGYNNGGHGQQQQQQEGNQREDGHFLDSFGF